MIMYSRILQILGYSNFILCLFFTIYGYMYPQKFIGGTPLNAISSILIILSFFVMLVLIGIFCAKVGNSYVDELVNFNVKNVVIYVICGINLVFRLFFSDTNSMENGSSLTASKLMAGLALALVLNWSVIVISTNYITQTNTD